MGRQPKANDQKAQTVTAIIVTVLIIVLVALWVWGMIVACNDIDARNKAPSTAHADNGIFYASNGMNLVLDSITAFDDYGRVKIGDTVIAIDIPIKDVPALKDALQEVTQK
jgi:hypothetical protein